MRTDKPAKKRRICTVGFYEDLMVCIKPNTNYKYNQISVTPQVSVHLNTDHYTPFKLKRKMWEIKSKRRDQIKVKVYKRN